ncbi:MAG: (E)-4-hydroxy-3-methylbut-2-enyl-diphosphate synthase [Bacteroidota bacterium]|nr:(E)-4-hydroxy-3-methylbut-2-enyl-diphosphate synthase [Bacteroidota bacterium]
MPKKKGENIYCENPFQYSRLKTRRVYIGEVSLGDKLPIRIQSMTNTSTRDTKASVDQCMRISNEGADIIRLAAINVGEAENLANIKAELKTKGYNIPLVADVHFIPRIALIAAGIVEKIRINPGNFISTKENKENCLQKIREKLIPVISKCKENNTTIRIGVNHGSLSQRILEKYGDTPKGMVESALEYLKICQKEEFHNLVFSMKASNTRVMVHAYRLLVNQLLLMGQVYPVHLGVTEAGEGEDGRIKSAVGIGTLLADGIGDTLRISLTEDPEKEVPVGKKFATYYENLKAGVKSLVSYDYPINPFEYKKRETREVLNIGGGNIPVVLADISENSNLKKEDLAKFGYIYRAKTKQWTKNDRAVDFLFLGNNLPDFYLPEGCSGILDAKIWNPENETNISIYPLFSVEEYKISKTHSARMNFVWVNTNQLVFDDLSGIIYDKNLIFILGSSDKNGFYEQRAFFSQLIHKGCNVPVILKRNYSGYEPELLQLISSADLGGLFLDGLGNGIWLEDNQALSIEESLSLSFGILQASRVRTTKTEYISCPSCGRTLFDIQIITAVIREKTQHLKGLKIGVMGCIVNGPGEMADADYGYVGSSPGKVTLYKNKEVIKKNIPANTAVEELIDLIKANGDWTEEKDDL